MIKYAGWKRSLFGIFLRYFFECYFFLHPVWRKSSHHPAYSHWWQPTFPICQAVTISSPSAPNYGYDQMALSQPVAGSYVIFTDTFPPTLAGISCVPVGQQLLPKLVCLLTSSKQLAGGPQKCSKFTFDDIPSYWQPSSSGTLPTTTHDCAFFICSFSSMYLYLSLLIPYCICILKKCCISTSPHSRHTPLQKKNLYYVTSLFSSSHTIHNWSHCCH